MNYWIISDTHFNHDALTDKWQCRPEGWQEKMWAALREIPSGDILIHLGDICIGGDDQVHRKIVDCTFTFDALYGPIKRILVRGNHDKRGLTWYNSRWDFVCDEFELEYMGYYIKFSHRPQPPMGRSTINIHGHTHGDMHRSEEYIGYYDPEYHKDISPEIVGFKPLRLDTFIKTFKTYGTTNNNSLRKEDDGARTGIQLP